MFTSVIAKIKRFVLNNKKAQAHSVVHSYLNCVDAVTPIVIQLYRDSAHSVIDKTFEKPEVLCNFIAALSDVVDHYGPALDAIADKHTTKFNSSALKAHIEHFEQQLEQLKA